MTVLMRAMQPADWPLARSDLILGRNESVHVAPARICDSPLFLLQPFRVLLCYLRL
jgi:hypothetical protein